MKNVHGRSPCCREKVVRFGNKRRKCICCGKTWSVHPRKRGRKRRHVRGSLIANIFSEKRTLAALAHKAGISQPAMTKRFRRSLDWYARRPSLHPLFRSRTYILLADALWFRFKGERWTLYLRAAKAATKNLAIFLEPVMLPGKENAIDWRRAIEATPEPLKKRIKALVSDGFRGSKRIAKGYRWIFQRCHFHLIAQLQVRRGKRKTTIPGRQTREEIYQTVRKILVRKNRSRVKILKNQLRNVLRRRDCPRKLKSIVREFLRTVHHFRAYLNHPELHLPYTTNTVESMNRLIRNSCGRLRTPESLARWAEALIQHHSTFTCKGANYQQN